MEKWIYCKVILCVTSFCDVVPSGKFLALFLKRFPLNDTFYLRMKLILPRRKRMNLAKSPPAFGPKMFQKSRFITSNLRNFIKTIKFEVINCYFGASFGRMWVDFLAGYGRNFFVSFRVLKKTSTPECLKMFWAILDQGKSIYLGFMLFHLLIDFLKGTVGNFRSSGQVFLTKISR
jgi:hypothetical protein